MSAIFERVRQFAAAPHAGFSDEDAKRFGEFLMDKAGLDKGPVEAEDIVRLARPKRSPIHDQFEWDNTKAAEQHRLAQARRLVRHIVVREVQSDGQQVETRAFHHVVRENGETTRGYVSERIVWHQPDLAAQIVAKAYGELRTWQARHRQYSELQSAIQKIDEILDEAA